MDLKMSCLSPVNESRYNRYLKESSGIGNFQKREATLGGSFGMIHDYSVRSPCVWRIQWHTDLDGRICRWATYKP